MLPLNHKRTTSTLAPPIFYVAKNRQLKDKSFTYSANIELCLLFWRSHLEGETVIKMSLFYCEKKWNKMIPFFSFVMIYHQTKSGWLIWANENSTNNDFVVKFKSFWIINQKMSLKAKKKKTSRRPEKKTHKRAFTFGFGHLIN